jgi:formate/nitrite transporter FocA (FNT family)
MKATDTTSAVTPNLDAFIPPEMAARAEEVGVRKATMGWRNTIALGVLAGAFIAMGAVFATTVTAGAAGQLPYGVTRLLGGLVFCLGLVLVVVASAELFTGNNLIVMAWAKCNLEFLQAVALGMGCNALVCLAVWLCFSARSVTDKILAILFPISAFVAAGFSSLTWGNFLLVNLLPVTIGNIIGGSVMVGMADWFIYIRKGMVPRSAASGT